MSTRVILAGGGTAGHIEPALAVADALIRKTAALNAFFLALNLGLSDF